jgi:Fe-S-cluster-containing hydrogenase component 2
MSSLSGHPAVKKFEERNKGKDVDTSSKTLEAQWLRGLCLDAGADDVGFVEIDRAELGDQRAAIMTAFPHTRTLVSFVCRMNRENVRSPARSVSNLEFHHTGDDVNEIARKIVGTLERLGTRAMNPSMGFPMEMDRFPDGDIRVVSHKPVAVAAGLGHMGIHRNVIHPKFGNFILLGTILIDAEVSEYTHPIDYNPCLECKLCVSACPVGAIGSDGHFDVSACYTHNYREFMGGFTQWAENIADSKSALEYRKKVNDSESASMWQSLSFGANYKSAYCMAVCPAGEDVIGPFLMDRKNYLADVVKPLQNKPETVYVVSGSDAHAYVSRRFPHKKVKEVRKTLRPGSIQGFLQGMQLTFQRHRSEGLNATYHFTFTGRETARATVTIREKRINVQMGHTEKADLQIIADSDCWIGLLSRERNLIWSLLRRKIRIKGGSPRLLLAFGKCFPS